MPVMINVKSIHTWVARLTRGDGASDRTSATSRVMVTALRVASWKIGASQNLLGRILPDMCLE